MKKILGIEIPDDLSALDNDALKALGKSLVAAAKGVAAGEVDPTVLGEVKEANAFAATLRDELATRKTADATLAADRTAALAEADELEGAFDDEADAESEAEGDEGDADDGDEAEGDEATGDEGDAADGKSVTAASGYRPKAGAIAANSETGSDQPDPQAKVPLGKFKATSGLNGHDAGEEFGSLLDLAEALQERYKDIAGGGRDKIKVATLDLPEGAFTPLAGDASKDAAIFAGYSPEQANGLTAAICAPREQVYDSVGAVLSSTARPVKGSLANYRPARGGVSVYPALKLADIESDDGSGYGQWTRADDADGNAEKVPVLLPCGNSVNYDIYGIWRALTITNMEQLTFPELVAAALNKLQTLQARMAEVALLDAALSSVNTKTALASTTDFGASINLFSTIANAVAIYREEERLGDQQFDAWLPRWVFPALQIDLLRQRRTSGRLADRVVTMSEVNMAFRDLGLDVTWTMDVASSWAPVPTFADGEALPALPVDIDLLFAPKGNLRALDRGSIDLGVTNNTVRDNESNRRNRFTLWYESFEGLIDFGATNYHLNLSGVCLSGAQTADVTAITDCAEAS